MFAQHLHDSQRPLSDSPGHFDPHGHFDALVGRPARRGAASGRRRGPGEATDGVRGGAGGRPTTVQTHPAALRLLVLRLTVLVVMTGAVFLLLTLAGSADELPAPTVEYVVAPGDTLWDIAESVAPPGGDMREVVDDIRGLNDLSGATIRPGQTLRLPLG